MCEILSLLSLGAQARLGGLFQNKFFTKQLEILYNREMPFCRESPAPLLKPARGRGVAKPQRFALSALRATSPEAVAILT
jgi:hypothetical protein